MDPKLNKLIYGEFLVVLAKKKEIYTVDSGGRVLIITAEV